MKRITDMDTECSIPMSVVHCGEYESNTNIKGALESNNFIQFKLNAYKEIIKKFLLDGK